MCSDLLIDIVCFWRWFLRLLCSENIVKLAQYSHDGVVAQYLDSSLFWTEPSAKYNFLETYEKFNITNSINQDYQMGFQ